jgi:hypothetical protein
MPLATDNRPPKTAHEVRFLLHKKGYIFVIILSIIQQIRRKAMLSADVWLLFTKTTAFFVDYADGFWHYFGYSNAATG